MTHLSSNSLPLDFMIDRINKKFSNILNQGMMTEKFDQEIHTQIVDDKIPKSLAVKRLIWSRGFQKFDEPIKKKNGVSYTYVHGHDGYGNTEARFEEFVIHLDNFLGKGPVMSKEPTMYLFHLKDVKKLKFGAFKF